MKRERGSQRAEVASHTTAWPPSLLGVPRVYRCSLEAGEALGEAIQQPRQVKELVAGGWGRPHWDTHTQTATRQTVGLGFQATLFTTPPTGRVFMQRAVHTSQNRTVPSSEPAGQDGVGQGQCQAWLPPGTLCRGLPRLSSAAWGCGARPQTGGESSRRDAAVPPAPAIPRQRLRTTAAPAPRRRDVTGGCCPENSPPPRSLHHRLSAPGPPLPDAHGSRRSCRAGSVPGAALGTARHGAALSSREMPAGSSPPRAGFSAGRHGESR